MFGELLSPTHLIFILAIVLVIFGPKRLPEIGQSLGKGIKEFRKSASELQDHITEEPAKPAAAEKVMQTEKAQEPANVSSTKTEASGS